MEKMKGPGRLAELVSITGRLGIPAGNAGEIEARLNLPK